MVTLPLAGWVTDTTVSAWPVDGVKPTLGSVSLARTSIVSAVFGAVVALSFAATGGAFGIVTVTVALALPPRPSETV